MGMQIRSDAKEQLVRQINSFYGITEDEMRAIARIYDKVIDRLEGCFRYVNNKYYHIGGDTIFDPLHVGQWTMFLYQAARQLRISSPDDKALCDKIYGVSKCLSSADIFYEVEMPSIWFFDHPQGSVMGRAHYDDFFTFSQGCTVGNNKGRYPRFGKHVSMMSGAKVLGDCDIGDHVIFAANAYVIDQDIPSCSIVFGMHPDNVIHPITLEKFAGLTGSMFDADDTVRAAI